MIMNVEVGRNVFELVGGLVSVGANKNRKPSNVTVFQSQEVGRGVGGICVHLTGRCTECLFYDVIMNVEVERNAKT